MKILAFSDVHLDFPSDPTDGSVELFLKTAQWIASLIDEHKPDAVVNGGDTNHTDGGMSTGTIKLTKAFFDPIMEACERTGAVLINDVGNHDQHTRNGEMHVMEFLKWRSIVIDKPEVVKVGATKLLIMPYDRDSGRFVANYQRLVAEETPALAFIHMDVVGARMNSGSKSSHGVTPEIAAVPTFGGHYHLPQDIKSSDGALVRVIGATQYTQHRDRDPLGGDRRGAILITTTKAKKSKPKVQRFTNPHTNLFAKFVGDTVEDLESQYNSWLTQAREIYPELSGKINVWFVGPKVELTKLEEKNDWSTLGLGTVRFTPNDKITAETTNLTLDLNPESAVREYFGESACSCGQPHSLDFGLDVIRKAEDYYSSTESKRAVRFKSMKMSNFMQFEDAQAEFDNKGLVLIEGFNHDDVSTDSNESGKSTIADALLWCLFDRTTKGLGKDEVIRWGSTEAHVLVSLEVDGVAYSISRSRKKGKQVLRIFDAEEKDITPHDQRTATETVANILGVSYEQFMLLVVMAQGFDTKFSALNDTDRKETLEAFLGLGVYDKARILVMDSIRELDMEARTIDDRALRAGSAKHTAEAQLNIANQERDRAAAEDRDERVRLETEISQAEAYVPQWRVTITAADKNYYDAAQAAKAADRAASDAKSLFEHRKSDYDRMTAEYSKQHELLAQYQTAQLTCPTCQQALPESQRQAAVDRQTQVLTELYADLSRRAEELNTLSEQLLPADEEAKRAHEALRAANDELRNLTSQFAALDAHLKSLRSQHEKTANTVERFDLLIRKSEEVIAAATADMTRAQADKIAYQQKRHELSFWLEAYEPTGIRSHLLRTVVNYLNDYLHSMSQTITGGTWTVQLSSTRELKSKKEAVNKLDILVLPRGESYKSGSGGKRRKIDLLLNLAVARLAHKTSGFSCNIRIADEVLDNLDFTASQYALRLLDDMTAEGGTILLISHDDRIKSTIPNVWTVTRRGGVSTLEV